MTDLKFANSVVADDDYPRNVHIRTNPESSASLSPQRYVVFDDVVPVSPVFWPHEFGKCKGFADGYSGAKLRYEQR